MKRLNLTLIIFLSIILCSCNEYQNLIKSDNNSEKFKSAENFYNSGDFKRANRLFEDIVPFYRGKPQAERLIFFYASSYYNLKMYCFFNYIICNLRFRLFSFLYSVNYKLVI